MRVLLANKANEDAANKAKERITAEFKGVDVDVRQVDRRWEVSLMDAAIGSDKGQSLTQPDIERMRRIAAEKDVSEITTAKKEVTVGSTTTGRPPPVTARTTTAVPTGTATGTTASAGTGA